MHRAWRTASRTERGSGERASTSKLTYSLCTLLRASRKLMFMCCTRCYDVLLCIAVHARVTVRLNGYLFASRTLIATVPDAGVPQEKGGTGSAEHHSARVMPNHARDLALKNSVMQNVGSVRLASSR